MKFVKIQYLAGWLMLCLAGSVLAQKAEPIRFTVSMPDPASHTFHVAMEFKTGGGDSTWLKIPDWQPGYYQLMDYASNIDRIVVKDERAMWFLGRNPANMAGL